jgi:hypothetical protein
MLVPITVLVSCMTGCNSASGDISLSEFAEYLEEESGLPVVLKDYSSIIKKPTIGDRVKRLEEWSIHDKARKRGSPYKYAFKVNKWKDADTCKGLTLTFKKDARALCDGPFSIIPYNSSVKQDAADEIHSAWKAFLKHRKETSKGE